MSKIPRTTARRLKAEKQRDEAVAALIAIKQDLAACGEVYGTDDARIQRINEGIKAAGFDPKESDGE
jgi:hypothetical protein